MKVLIPNNFSVIINFRNCFPYNPLKHQYESKLFKSASIAVLTKYDEFFNDRVTLYRKKVIVHVSISMKEKESFENAKKKQISKEVYVFSPRYEDIPLRCLIDKGIKVSIIKANTDSFIVARTLLMSLSTVAK